MPSGSVPAKKLELKMSDSGAVERTWEEEEVSPEDTASAVVEMTNQAGWERNEMATYERLQPKALLQVL